MSRIVISLIGLIFAMGAGGWIYVTNSVWGQIYLPSGTGITAKQICSLTHVSGLSPDRARALYVDPLLGPAGDFIDVRFDDEAGSVTASVMGAVFKQTAVHRDGIGCSLVHDWDSFDASLSRPLDGALDPMRIDGQWRNSHFDPVALDTALETVFTDDGRNTLAALVLHEGRLVAERYADGVDAQTPLHGWSMTKSTAATFAGVLVQRGLLDIQAEGAIPALAEVNREDITLDHLLRMTGGLDGFEYNNGSDPNSEMLFTQPDMAAYAASRNRLHAPGAHWDYQSGNTILAGHGMEAHMGDGVGEEIDTLRRWLFEPLGMTHSVLEPDQSGTLQWSSYMYASARDWARMGQLYLDDGRVGDEQIIPPNWLNYVGAPTATSDGQYGSGFWINQPGIPSDAVIMRGFQQQWAFVIPSEDLVVVRLGATLGSDGGAVDFAAAVIDAKLDQPLTAPEPGPSQIGETQEG